MPNDPDALRALQGVTPILLSVAAPPPRVRRDGDVVVAPNHATLPKRCLFCNDDRGCQPVQIVCRPSQTDEMKVHNAGALAVLALLVAAFGIGFTVIRRPKGQPVQATVFFCARHRRKRQLSIGIPLALLLASGFGNSFACHLDNCGWWVPDWLKLALLAGVPVFSVATLGVWFLNLNWRLGLSYTPRSMRISGAGEAFLQSLPTDDTAPQRS